jgi:hypothetical protein
MRALWLFLPILGGYLAHAPVLRFELLPQLKRPLDGGLTLRGRRLLGDNKTWRGALAMAGGVLLMTLVLAKLPAWWGRLPEDVRAAGPFALGLVLGLGMVLGELPNSFVKRQLGIEPGARGRAVAGVALSLFDQADFVVAVWIFLLPIWHMPWTEAVIAFGIVALAHLGVSALGYAIGARRTFL